MQTVFQQLINSLTIGAEYALIALGYTMVFGILRLINFAHGDVYMVGAFVGAYAAQAISRAAGASATAAQSGVQFAAVVLISMAACGLLGYVIERLAYRPLRNRSRLSALITAIGISLLLENLVQLPLKVGGRVYFGPNEETFPPVGGKWFNNGLESVQGATGLSVVPRDMVEFGCCACALLVLWVILRHTRMGKAMRAVSMNYDASRLMGINLNTVISFTFVLGSVLAGLGACLYGVRASKVTYSIGIMLGLKAFIAAVVGGIGSIPGAAAGGFVLGFAETLVSSVHIGGVSLSPYRDGFAFVLLILVLLVRPEGLFGRAAPEKV